ncbi:MAG: GGDEF domain-containing protein [Acidobacteriota bacterium]
MSKEKAPAAGLELNHLDFLRGGEFEKYSGLLEECPIQELKAGEVLISAGEANEFLYLLVSGKLKIQLKLDLEAIAQLEPGEVVGELSLIDGQLTSAYVVAEVDSTLLVLDVETMWSLVDASPIARNLLISLARRLRKSDTQVLSGQHLQQEYQSYAVSDALTGVYNRRWLNKMMARQMERSKTDDHGLSLLLVDIDDFRQYNQTHGQAAGDRILYTVARAIRDSMRPGEIIARFGGDQFVTLLPDTDVLTARKIADRLCQTVAATPAYGSDRSLLSPVTISIGVAQMQPTDTPDSFVDSADQDLREGRDRGENV